MITEGWFLDPFGLHVDRWFSDGVPTKLVTDGDVTSHDPPPSAEVAEPLLRSPETESVDGSDLVRAEAVRTNPDYQRAALDIFDLTTGHL